MIRLSVTCDACGRTVRHICENGGAVAPSIDQQVIESLKAALAERDRRIEAALAYCDDWKPIAFAWSIQRILRGES